MVVFPYARKYGNLLSYNDVATHFNGKDWKTNQLNGITRDTEAGMVLLDYSAYDEFLDGLFSVSIDTITSALT